MDLSTIVPIATGNDGTVKPEHKCPDCSKVFRFRKDFKRHCLIHTGERPYLCKECGKSFARSTNRNKHLKTHFSDPKPFQCPKCPSKTFGTKHDLERHIDTHSGVKPFHCQICRQQFARKDKLTRHQLTHAPSDQRPAFPCDICGKNFSRNSTLITHRFNHTGTKPLHCPQPKCLKSYSTNWQLQRHLVTHSGVPAFTCDICSKGFYLKDKLKQHIQLHSSRLSTRVNRQNKLKKINSGIPSRNKKQCMNQINGDESVLVKLEVVTDEDSSCDQSSFGCGFESFIEIDEKPLIENEAHDMECGGVVLTAIKQEVIHEELEDGNMNEHVSYDKVRADKDDCALDIKKEEPPKLVTLTEARSSLHVLRSYARRTGKISNEFLSALVTIENALDNATLEQE